MSARGAPVAAGQGADINVILSQGQKVTGFSSNPLVNSSVSLGNASRQDTTQAGPGADIKTILSQGQVVIDQRTGQAYGSDFTALAAEPVFAKTPIDCEGSWGACDYTTGLRTYSVERQANSLGKKCPNGTGDIQPCSKKFFKDVRYYIAENTKTSNLVVLVFIILVLSVFISGMYLLRDMFK